MAIAKMPDGTPLNVAVYKAYRNAGLSHNQALAITAEVGRENGFQPNILFGSHIDPAANSGGGAIQNAGMLSWNGNRGQALTRFLQAQGVMQGGAMVPSQANLNAQARFSVSEMKSPSYARKLQTFWNNPNANPEAYSRELGKNYVVWAYGQNSIRAKGGGRQAFDWQSHDARRRNYLQNTANMLGDTSNYQAQQSDPRLAMSAPELIKALRKDKKMNDNELFVSLANGNGRAAQEINYLLDAGHSPDEIASQLGLKVKIAKPPQSQAQQEDTGLQITPEEMQILGIDTPDEQAQVQAPDVQPSTFKTLNQPEIQAETQPTTGIKDTIIAELPKLKEQGLTPYQAIYTLAQRDDDIGHSIKGAFGDGMKSEQIANYFGVNDIWQSQNEQSSNTLTQDVPRVSQMPLS